MKVHKKKIYGKKKDLGTFLQKKKSYRKIVKFCKKYLHKYGGFDLTHEFDRGSIQIIILPYGKKSKKENKPKDEDE